MDNISAIKEKIDIVELISGYVPLKRAGKNYKALCPFHTEKTPSFMVSPELQRYRCFGCSKGGDIFGFVMEIEGVDFAEALKILADRAGVKLQFDSSKSSLKEKSQKERIIQMNALAAKFYAHLLMGHKYGEKARKYLRKRRVNSSTIRKFQLGYAPKSWDSLSNFLQKSGYSPGDIVIAGLGKFRKGNKNTYDMFRGRLVFPLFDHMDRIIGFAGRALYEGQTPKYINTPETPVFHKERFLYGLNFTKTNIRQKNIVNVVEGEFDMIIPYQAGVRNIAASKGTALTIGQANLIKRYCDTVVLIFDSDEAGLDAMVRGTEVIQGTDLNVKVALLPKKYKDPDEMVRKDLAGFKVLIKKAVPLWDFYFKYASEKFDFSDVFDKKRASDFLLQRVRQINDEIIRAEYIKKFMTIFDVDEQTVLNRLGRVNKTTGVALRDVRGSVDVEKDENLTRYPSGEIYLLSLLTKATTLKLRLYVDSTPVDYFVGDATRSLFSELKKSLKKRRNLDVKEFYDKLQDSHPEAHSLFESIYLLDIKDYLQDPDLLDAEMALAVKRLKRGFLSRKLKELAKDISKAEAVSDAKLVKMLQKEVRKLSGDLANLK